MRFSPPFLHREKRTTATALMSPDRQEAIQIAPLKDRVIPARTLTVFIEDRGLNTKAGQPVPPNELVDMRGVPVFAAGLSGDPVGDDAELDQGALARVVAPEPQEIGGSIESIRELGAAELAQVLEAHLTGVVSPQPDTDPGSAGDLPSDIQAATPVFGDRGGAGLIREAQLRILSRGKLEGLKADADENHKKPGDEEPPSRPEEDSPA
jgi:hypothetical protein